MTRTLPIATPFCTAEIEFVHGMSLFLDGNGKITRGNGTYEWPAPNAFSLPAASVASEYAHALPRACPDSTPTCRESCYVRGLARGVPDLYGRYIQNAETLAACLADDRLFDASAAALGKWIREFAPGGFRWHVSGDVWNTQHAEWIATVCDHALEIEFWIYTRTLSTVGILASTANLAVNVSADRDNYAAALATAQVHGVRVCYLADASGVVPDSLPPGSVIFPDYALRTRTPDADRGWWESLPHDHKAMICPTDQFGQSEAHRCGPCGKCF